MSQVCDRLCLVRLLVGCAATSTVFAGALPACHESSAGRDAQVVLHNQLADDAETSYLRGIRYAERSDFSMAAKAWQEAAAAGHAGAMAQLGALYAEGRGVSQDLARAVELFQRSVDAGSPDGMSHLGVAYLAGDGVEPDTLKARELFERGAALGDATCMHNLGILYLRGFGLEPDEAKALEWLQRAASAGSDTAQTYLQNQGIAYDDPGTP